MENPAEYSAAEGTRAAKVRWALLSGAVLALVIQSLGVGARFLSQIALARWMGPLGYGEYSYVVAWIVLCTTVSNLGLPTTVLRFIPHYIAKEEWSRLKGVVRRSRALVLLANLILASIFLLAFLRLSGILHIEETGALIWGILALPMYAFADLQVETLRALRRVAFAYWPSLVLRPILIVVGSYVILRQAHRLTSTSAMLVTVLALAATVLLQMLLLWRAMPDKIGPVIASFETRRWLDVATPLLFVAVFGVVLSQTDVLLLGLLLGPKFAGLYGAAAKTASLVSFVLVAVNAVGAPMFAALYAERRIGGLQRLLTASAHWIFWPSLGIGAVLILSSRFLLGLFGTAFVVGTLPLAILIFGQLVNAGAGSVGYLMMMTGHQRQCAMVLGWCALLNVALSLVAIPAFGMVGAAICTAVTTCLWNGWLHVLVVKHVHVRPSIVSAIRASATAS